MYPRTYIVYVCDTLQNGAIGWRRGYEWLNKVVIFVFFAHRKYSHRFVILRLNRWCHVDYFNDVFTTFLSVDRVRILAVYRGSESSSKTSSFVFWRWTKVLLERRAGEELMTDFHPFKGAIGHNSVKLNTVHPFEICDAAILVSLRN